MSKPAIKRATTLAPSLRDVLELRSWARAYLWWAGEYSLHEAIDVLQHDAERDGLDANVAQEILAAAFRPFREGEHD